MTLDDVDLWDLDQFVDGRVAEVFRTLRAEAPVWWHDRPGGEPFWAVTRMEHARTVFRDPMTFSSQANGVMLPMLRDRSQFDAIWNDVSLLGEPVRVRSNFVGGPKHLPVRLVPR